MNRLEEIKNKYDFYFGEGNPEIDSIADSDTSWLIIRVEELMNIANALIGADPWEFDDEDQKLFERFKEIQSGEESSD